MMDKRRYGLIEVRQVNERTYFLEINGRLWAEVEWSHERQRWCIQDAAGHCLTHVEHIVGQDKDPQTAIRLAKKMIWDGRMPTPEEAHAQLQAEQEAKRNPAPELGEPFTMEGVPEPVAVGGKRASYYFGDVCRRFSDEEKAVSDSTAAQQTTTKQGPLKPSGPFFVQRRRPPTKPFVLFSRARPRTE